MKTLFVWAALLACPLATLAQTTPQGNDAQLNLNNIGTAGTNGVVRTYDNRYDGVRNSPYLLDPWLKGNLLLANGQKYEQVSLKLNTHQDELVFRRTGGDSVILNRQNVAQFELSSPAGQPLAFRCWQPEGASQPGYYQVLAQGKYGLYVRHTKTLLKADFKGAYSSGRTYDEFVDEKTYYLTLPDQPNTLVKVKLSPKTLLKALQDKGPLAQYAEKENLDLKKEADVARLLAFANQ
ncbi:MAG: hypothetical protein MUC97_09015 [Bernardetiaceae bacterium]|jgi:hypothetical protein|nr:hypothetical protein [Bernardetiaceae bacterium]